MVEASKFNIKTIFVQVRSRGDALYNSKLVKMNSRVEKNFDPLQYILKWGILLDIDIHAWMNTYLIWSAPYPPADPSHIYYTNPEWFDSDYFGKTDVDINLNNIQSPEWEGLFLSPNNINVNLYILDLVKEIIANYPGLKGIHFDYIRFHDEYFGFNKDAIKNFKFQFGFNPKDIYRGVFNQKFGWSSSEIDSISNLWRDYNSNAITNLIRSVKSFRDLNNINILISAAVKSNILESKNRWYQDWKYWIENNIIDFVVPMNYAINKNEFIDNIKIINKNILIDQINDKIIMGISIYNQDELNIAEKVLLTNLSGYNKICFFSYNSIKNNSINLNSIKTIYNKKKHFMEVLK